MCFKKKKKDIICESSNKVIDFFYFEKRGVYIKTNRKYQYNFRIGLQRLKHPPRKKKKKGKRTK